MTTTYPELVYVGSTDIEIHTGSRDLRGLVAVDPGGLRLGEVADVVVDLSERRPRLISIVSGGLLGLEQSERLVPIEAVTEVDERVRIDRSAEFLHALLQHGRPPTVRTSSPESPPEPAEASREQRFAEVYAAFGLVAFWDVDRPAS